MAPVSGVMMMERCALSRPSTMPSSMESSCEPPASPRSADGPRNCALSMSIWSFASSSFSVTGTPK